MASTESSCWSSSERNQHGWFRRPRQRSRYGTRICVDSPSPTGWLSPLSGVLGTRVGGAVTEVVADPVDHAGGRPGHFGPRAAGGRGRVGVGGRLALAVGQLLADVVELLGAEGAAQLGEHLALLLLNMVAHVGDQGGDLVVVGGIRRVHVLQGGQGLLDLLVLVQALVDQVTAVPQGLFDLRVEVGLLDGGVDRQLTDDLVDHLPLGLGSLEATLVVGEQLLDGAMVLGEEADGVLMVGHGRLLLVEAAWPGCATTRPAVETGRQVASQRVNQPTASSATCSKVPGSSKRWLAPGTISR